jgi:DNA (cytosine-5)-methyltransferase 1
MENDTDKRGMTLGSLFDGSGGFPLGGLISGITPVWASEIEPFPVRVTTKRLPFIKHYGDVSKLDGRDMEPVDIITFGSPCQDMSIAGKREGLDGNRSGLFYQAIRIIREMREKTNGEKPRYIVWENVQGAFSSNKGEDFRCVLESVCRIADETVSVPPVNKWAGAGHIMGTGFSVAWRTLDAQYWGVPQRRKRIYLVADFAGGSAGKILFESEGVSGYSAEGFRAWQGTASPSCRGAQKAGGTDAGIGTGAFLYKQGAASRSVGFEEEKSPTLSTDANHVGVVCLNDQGGERMDVTEGKTSTLRAGANHPPLVFENHSQDSRYTGPLDVAQTVLSTFGTGGNNQPFVVETPKTLKIRSGCDGGGKGPLIQDDKSATLGTNNDQTLFQPKVYGICSKTSHSMLSDNPKSGFYEAETTRTLDANGGSPVCNQGGMAVVEPVPFTQNQRDEVRTLMSAHEKVADTLVATDYKDPPLINDKDGADYIVRRLTPTECARLQGFPDWWCNDLGTEKPTDEEMYFWYQVFETYRDVTNPGGKMKTSNQIRKWLQNPASDSAEYKMWGNGVALPCVVFVLSGIVYYAQKSGS